MAQAQHLVAPGEAAFQLDLPLTSPDGLQAPCDRCVARLETRLEHQAGVRDVHLMRAEDGRDLLCLHYDPNLMSLEKLQRLARDEGAAISDRFQHQTFALRGMAQGTNVANIEAIVARVPGVFNVAVNYASERIWIEYDGTLTDRDAIATAIENLGYRDLDAPADHDPADHDPADHNHSGHKHEHLAGAGGCAGHSHGPFDPDAPWIVRNWQIALSLLSGLLLGVGFLGEQFLGLPFGVALIFYLGAYLAGGTDLARHTVPTVVRGKFDVEFLMLVGAGGAALLGNWAEGAFLLFLFSFGHALEHFAMDSARHAIRALGALAPTTARVLTPSGESEVPIESLRLGQTVLVRPGDRVPVDGTVLRGRSALDQSPITGESVPVERAPGEGVFAGSINGDGALEVEVTRLSSDSTLARVQQMVEEAQSQKSPSQTFTDRFERVFVPAVLGVTLVAAIGPPLLGWLPWREAIFRAISTVVAASPCALALATPSAVLAGIARAAQNGVLIKGGVHLENLGTLRAIAFDKTGTLTRGQPEVSDVWPAPGVAAAELLSVAAAVETRSAHPLAQAVVRRARQDQLALPAAGELQTLQGRGVQAPLGAHLIRIGNFALFEAAGLSVPDALHSQLRSWGENGKPTMIVARDDQILGALALADPIRANAHATLQKLRALGITALVMLTGDNARVAHNIAPQVGVTQVRADLLPAQKVEVLRELLAQYGQVAMIGDGVNDAPALANATVGIAMGAGGSDVALETADVALMANDLAKLPFAVALSRQAKSIIRQNLVISLGVIALLVPATLLGLAHLSLAVIFHEGSTLVVVFNALRLLRFREK